MRTRLHTRLHTPRSRGRRIALLAASLVTLVAAIFGTIGLVAAIGGPRPASGFPPNPGKNSQTPVTPVVGQKQYGGGCGEAGEPVCPPTPSAGWLQIASDSPAAVLAALPSLYWVYDPDGDVVAARQ